MDNYNRVNFEQLIDELDNESQFLYQVEDMEYKLIENLVKARKRLKMTQKDISKITGMTQQAVSRIEKYGNKPSLTNLLKYMRALNVDINLIFNETTTQGISEKDI